MYVIVPDLYLDFKCIADKCPYTCCKHWNIHFDQPTYHLMEEHEEVLGIKASDWLVEADDKYLVKLQAGACPLLDERGMCNVVLKLGPEYLCPTCNNFPRAKKMYGGIVEPFLSVACPEVIRIIMDSERISFSFSEDTSDIKIDGKESVYFFESSIRSAVDDILQNVPEIDLSARLFASYKLIEKSVELYNHGNKVYEQIADELSDYAIKYLNVYFDYHLQENVGSMPKLEMMRRIVCNFSGDSNNHIFDEHLTNVLNYINGVKLEQYENDLKNLNREMDRFSGFFGRYWTYLLFFKLLNTSNVEKMKDNFLFIAMELFAIKTFLLAQYVQSGKLNKNDIILTISETARRLEHSKILEEQWYDLFEKNDMVSSASLLLII